MNMDYTSFAFYLFVPLLLVVYCVFPKKYRWIVLLAGSVWFYYRACRDYKAIGLFASTIVVSYLSGLLISRLRNAGRAALARVVVTLGIVLSAFPLVFTKILGGWLSGVAGGLAASLIVPLGLAFYTLQIVSYQVDVYKGVCEAERNFFKYALYVTFFPQIIQGPIPRYQQLAPQLFQGATPDYWTVIKGIQRILWGFFLKYMIADKAAVVVDTVFGNPVIYTGLYVLVAGVLYSAQLYADFLACVTISQGVAEMFGIQLADNFRRPYFAESIKEFWARWHLSLSRWLRDYIYIPLGGNRKGRLRKYLNIMCTFLVSGFWHGNRWSFIFWGLLHAFYQIVEDLTGRGREKLLTAMRLQPGNPMRRYTCRFVTFVLVTAGWIFFRADGLRAGAHMIATIFTGFNPWILFDGSLLELGLDSGEWTVLALAVGTLILVSTLQERNVRLREWVNSQCLVVRWAICLGAIWCVWVFGSYGFGYNAADFIYGGF